MSPTILHVDMDAFFAAVEQRDCPEYRGKPVIVGADPKGGKGRGIVATCSYEARRFGIHSAQPISEAWRRCPGGIFVRPRSEAYRRASERVMAILGGYSDLVEQISIDEAFLDVAGSRRLFGSAVEIARRIKERIRADQKLTASVGVASNKFIAKIASDLDKPDGLVVVEPGREAEFLDPLPVGRLWGVGAKTEAALRRLGIERIGQLARFDRSVLIRRFGAGGEHLWRLAHGRDERPVEPEEGCKSIGHETTFEHDTSDFGLLRDTLLALTEKVAHRLRAHGIAGRTITVKLREEDFTTRTRRRTLNAAADTTEAIYPAALELMGLLYRKSKKVRLIGVSAGNLASPGGGQLELFGAAPDRTRRLAEAVDAIAGRFGSDAITRAALVRPAGQNRQKRK